MPLENGTRVAGLKQVTKGIISNGIGIVYLAVDCDKEIEERILSVCGSRNVPVKRLYTQEELGKACNIDVRAAVVGIIK